MTERRRANIQPDVTGWLDETETILNTLQQLIKATESPIVKLCLEEAYDDIAHLTFTGKPKDAPTEKASVA